MPEFFNVFASDVALRTLLERLQKRVETETVPTHQALGRVTAEAVRAPEHLPAFPRSTMDGYAVRARETFGASESLPAYLEVVGEVRMGEVIVPAGGRLRPQDIGGLLALGLTQVKVRRRPRVAIVSTGDEIVAPDITPAPGQIRDINARHELLPEAGARHERTLEAASSRPLLGWKPL